MKSKVKKIAALCLIGALLLVGCSSGADTTWVFEYGGLRVPAGLYISYLIDSVSEVENREYEAHTGDDAYETPGLKDLLKVDVDGVNAEEWAVSHAAGLARQYFWVEQTFDDMDLLMTLEEQESISDTIDSFWSYYGSYYENNGIGQESLKAYQVNLEKKQKIFDALYGPDGEMGVSEAELKQILTDEYAKADYLYVNKVTGEGEQTGSIGSILSQNNEIKSRLEDYRERLLDGEEFEQIIYEEQVAQELSLGLEEDPADHIEKPAKGAYTMIVTREWASTYGEDFIGGIFDTSVGGVRIVESDEDFLLIMRYDMLEDPADFESRRDSILNGLKWDEFQAYLEEESRSIDLTENTDALRRYRPSGIKEML